MKDILIIGGGAAGILSVYEIVRSAERGSIFTIHIVEKDPYLGGLAYNLAALPHLVLNTQIGRMSALNDDPNHLLNWLNSPVTKRYMWPNHYDKTKLWHPLEFCPRELYGYYLRDIFEAALLIAQRKGIRINCYCDEVIDIQPYSSNRMFIVLKRHMQFIHGDVLILCVGQLSSEKLPFQCDCADDPNFIKNVWSHEGVKKVKSTSIQDNILIIGTGLTANDLVFERYKKLQSFASQTPHQLPIIPGHTYLESRHAAFHVPYSEDFHPITAEKSLKKLEILKTIPFDKRILKLEIKKLAADLEQEGVHPEDIYRATIKTLLPAWQRLPLQERQSLFMKYKYLDVYRTGVSSLITDCIEQMKQDKLLSITAGKIVSIKRENGEFSVIIELKRRMVVTSPIIEITVDRIFNATGFENNVALSASPLLKGLIDKGLAEPDDLGLGLKCKQNGQLRGKIGTPIVPIFLTGALTTGCAFETEGKLGSTRSIAGIRRQIPRVIPGIYSALKIF